MVVSLPCVWQQAPSHGLISHSKCSQARALSMSIVTSKSLSSSNKGDLFSNDDVEAATNNAHKMCKSFFQTRKLSFSMAKMTLSIIAKRNSVLGEVSCPEMISVFHQLVYLHHLIEANLLHQIPDRAKADLERVNILSHSEQPLVHRVESKGILLVEECFFIASKSASLAS